jgi:hypothetical protein
MTRETKVGLVVAGSFICLVGVVLALKLRQTEDTVGAKGLAQANNPGNATHKGTKEPPVSITPEKNPTGNGPAPVANPQLQPLPNSGIRPANATSEEPNNPGTPLPPPPLGDPQQKGEIQNPITVQTREPVGSPPSEQPGSPINNGPGLPPPPIVDLPPVPTSAQGAGEQQTIDQQLQEHKQKAEQGNTVSPPLPPPIVNPTVLPPNNPVQVLPAPSGGTATPPPPTPLGPPPADPQPLPVQSPGNPTAPEVIPIKIAPANPPPPTGVNLPPQGGDDAAKKNEQGFNKHMEGFHAGNNPVLEVKTPPIQSPPSTPDRAPSPIAVTVPPSRPAEAPQVIMTETKVYTLQHEDKTFADLSRKFYGTPDQADALLRFNRDYPMASDAIKQNPPLLIPGQRVFVPDPATLRQGTAEPASKITPIPIGSSDGAVAPSPPPIAAPTPPPPSPNPGGGMSSTINLRPVASSTGTTNGQVYQVATQGEMILNIAERTLGDRMRWSEIYRLNPQINPSSPIPGGTVLRLPSGQ